MAAMATPAKSLSMRYRRGLSRAIAQLALMRNHVHDANCSVSGAYQRLCAQAESWAFALDGQGLELMMEKGIFWTRTCKVCHGDEGIVVASEYGMSKAILEAGFNLATLMAR